MRLWRATQTRRGGLICFIAALLLTAADWTVLHGIAKAVEPAVSVALFMVGIRGLWVSGPLHGKPAGFWAKTKAAFPIMKHRSSILFVLGGVLAVLGHAIARSFMPTVGTGLSLIGLGLLGASFVSARLSCYHHDHEAGEAPADADYDLPDLDGELERNLLLAPPGSIVPFTDEGPHGHPLPDEMPDLP